MMADERYPEHQSLQPEPRSVGAVWAELQRRLGDASRVLHELHTQHATCSALLAQFQNDLDAAMVLSREMRELAERKPDEPSTVVTALQAAVETVAGQVEHVRERAVAALHRMKGNGPEEKMSGGRNDCNDNQ